MLRPWIWALGLCLLIPLGSLASAQEIRPPQTITFVVGVQHYDDPDLNRLQYTLRDAQDVFEQLKAVTNLDLERSRLLLADPKATDEPDPNDPDWMIRKDKLGLQEIQDELADFLEMIKNDETVMFYFGGHGTVQAEQHLLFLPSDYSRRPQKRFWRYRNIIDDIRGRIDDRNLRNVSVVFFANMCGAGTAAGDMSAEADLDTEFVKEWLANNTLGFERFALFPASAPNQNTFESPEFERSVFAHHLLEGLRGSAAKNGVITAESLFSYLDENIQDDLPKNPVDFDPTIPIGVTRELEGHALYLNGLSLLSDALDTDDPLFWRLAERNLEEAASFLGVGRLGALAALRLAQVRAMHGDDPAELSGVLAAATASVTADAEIRAAAARLLEAAKRASKQRFAAVIVTSETEKELHRWSDFLLGIPGHLSTALISLNLTSPEKDRWLRILEALVRLAKEHENAEEIPHLVFVYSGRAGWHGERITPFSVDAFRAFVDQWKGAFTLIYDAPFGGFLKKAFDAGTLGDISLVLSARETNGITFSSSSSDRSAGDTTELLISMLKAHVVDVINWPPFDTYLIKHGEAKLPELSPAEQELYDAEFWVIGTPSVNRPRNSPSPVFAEVTDAMREASAGLSPVRRLASVIATGCDARADPACMQLASGPVDEAIEGDGVAAALGQVSSYERTEPEAVYDLLKKAALLDFSGDMKGAFATYNQFLQLHEEVHRTLGENQPAAEDELREQARRSLDRVTNQVRNRVEGLEGKLTRQVHLLLAAVSEYTSPLVPDLIDAEGDLRAWETIFEASGVWRRALDLGENSSPVNVRQLDTSSRSRLLDTLGEALRAAGHDDLVVFVFSGRGIEIAGERYLAPANVYFGTEDAPLYASLVSLPRERREIAGEALSTAGQPFSPTTQELVSIAEITEQARDRWFVGIYDTQFTQPVFEAERADSVLDKHLNSVRPSLPETPATPVLTSFELEQFPAGAKDFPGKHVHIWWEGRLTERLTAPATCEVDLVRKVGSPMTTALLAALLEQPYATYRDWIKRAQEHPCLGTPASFGFVAQGSTDLPRFASGNAATQIPYFLSARERRDVNLHAAERVTEIASQSGDHPLFALSRAAVLVGLTDFARSSPSEEEHEQSDWLEEALDLLRPLLQSAKVQEYDLQDDVLDLFTRALVLNGDDDEARNYLLDAPSPQLTSATLLKRLLDLTEAELRQSPTGILEATREKLAELETGGLETGVSPDLTARLAELSSSYEEPRGQYRIVTSLASSP